MGNSRLLKFIRKSSKYWVLPLGLTITGILLLAFRSRINPPIVPEVSPTPTEQTYPIDNLNDGIYTDYKYGFKFKYPKDVFINQTKPFYEDNKLSVSWDVTEEGESHMGVNPEGAGFSLNINLTDLERDSLVQQFESAYKIPVGQMDTRGNRILRKFEMPDGNRGLVYKYDLPKWRIYSVGPNLNAVWIKGDETVWLDLFYNSKNNDKKYQKIFNEMVTSFEFIQ